MTKDDLFRFSELGVATVYEASGREGLIDIPLIQLIPGSRAAGPARTALCGQDDNLMVHAVIEQIQPGEVLVLEPRRLAARLAARRVAVEKGIGDFLRLDLPGTKLVVGDGPAAADLGVVRAHQGFDLLLHLAVLVVHGLLVGVGHFVMDQASAKATDLLLGHLAKHPV